MSDNLCQCASFTYACQEDWDSLQKTGHHRFCPTLPQEPFTGQVAEGIVAAATIRANLDNLKPCNKCGATVIHGFETHCPHCKHPVGEPFKPRPMTEEEMAHSVEAVYGGPPDQCTCHHGQFPDGRPSYRRRASCPVHGTDRPIETSRPALTTEWVTPITEGPSEYVTPGPDGLVADPAFQRAPRHVGGGNEIVLPENRGLDKPHRYVVVLLAVEGTDLDRHAVLIQKKDRPAWQRGKLNLPGGRIEPGESPSFAARREIGEETGLIIPENLGVCGTLEGDDWVVYCFGWHYPFDHLVARVPRVILPEGETEPSHWVEWGLLKDDPRLIDNLRTAIPWMLNGRTGWSIRE